MLLVLFFVLTIDLVTSASPPKLSNDFTAHIDMRETELHPSQFNGIWYSGRNFHYEFWIVVHHIFLTHSNRSILSPVSVPFSMLASLFFYLIFRLHWTKREIQWRRTWHRTSPTVEVLSNRQGSICS